MATACRCSVNYKAEPNGAHCLFTLLMRASKKCQGVGRILDLLIPLPRQTTPARGVMIWYFLKHWSCFQSEQTKDMSVHVFNPTKRSTPTFLSFIHRYSVSHLARQMFSNGWEIDRKPPLSNDSPIQGFITYTISPRPEGHKSGVPWPLNDRPPRLKIQSDAATDLKNPFNGTNPRDFKIFRIPMTIWWRTDHKIKTPSHLWRPRDLLKI